MNNLRTIIKNKINSNQGRVTLDEFIKVSMYEDKYGYYIKKNPIGKKGDFITSPEISQLFGELIGLYIVDYWKNYTNNNNINLVELGPGKGTLIQDLIRISSKFPEYLSSINLHLIEINKKMIENQKKILKKKINKLKNVCWSDKIDKLSNCETVIIANEFFDCFPIKQIIKNNNEFYERIVKYNKINNKFVLDSIKISNSSKLANITNKIYKKNNLTEGCIAEIELESEEYIKNIGKILLKNGGLLIMIDYGNYRPSGHSTIQSVKKHKKTSFLDDPGNQDLSHMLDFSYFQRFFKKMNLEVYGPYSQKDFFISLGIHKLEKKILEKSSKKQKKDIIEGLKKILGDNQMGQLFKVLIVSTRRLIIHE